MPKLQRKSAKLFAEDAAADVGGIGQFGSLAAGNVNYSKDPDVIQALPAFKNGWSSAVTGNKSPAIEDRNALDYLLSYQQAYIMQRGVPEWIDTETYYEGSFVSKSDGKMYVSKIDNNTNHDPDTDISETYWLKFPTPAEVASITPAGIIQMSPLSSLAGYLLCNGQAVSRTTYANLFAAIGTSFGQGDGSTTFNVPDYRGCFLRGLGGNSASDVYTKQNSGVPNITGSAIPGGVGSQPIYIGNTSGSLYSTQRTNYMTRGENQGPGPTGLGFDASRSSNVYQNGLTEVRPTNFAINYFIKY